MASLCGGSWDLAPHFFTPTNRWCVVCVVDKDHMDSRGRQLTSRPTSTVRTFDSARVTHLDVWHLRSQYSLRSPFPLQCSLTKSRASLHNRFLFSSYLSSLTFAQRQKLTGTLIPIACSSKWLLSAHCGTCAQSEHNPRKSHRVSLVSALCPMKRLSFMFCIRKTSVYCVNCAFR